MSWELTLTDGDEVISANQVLYGTTAVLGEKSDIEIRNKLIGLETGTGTGILPPVVRWVSPQRRYALLERPPQTIDINYYGVRQYDIVPKKATLQEHTISLPWTLYLIAFDAYMRPVDSYVFALSGPLEHTDTLVGVMPLTNTYANGRFCLPALPEIAANPVPEKPWTMGEGINAAYSQIWMSNFNTDIVEVVVNAYKSRRPRILFPEDENDNYMKVMPARMLKKWSALSLEEVAAINDWPLPNRDYQQTVRMVMNDAMNWENGNYSPNVLFNTFRGLFTG